MLCGEVSVSDLWKLEVTGIEDSSQVQTRKEIATAAREKERMEALERCREREQLQREREQLAKEKARAREEHERERAKRVGDRREHRGSSRDSRRRPITSDDKRHDRIYDRCDRKVIDRERVRDRALVRVMERKSIDRNRDRSRESYESRRIIQDDKPYSSPYSGDSERGRSGYETERDRERVGGQDVRSGGRGGYDSAGETDRRSRRDRQAWVNGSSPTFQDSQTDKRDREPIVGEVVLIGSDDTKRMDWSLGLVENVSREKDGACRVVILRTAQGSLRRPLQRIYPLEVVPDSESKEDVLVSTPKDGEAKISERTEPVVHRELKTRCGRKVVIPVRYL